MNELNHLAIVMDGNGRWAKSRALVRTNGHEVGAAKVEEIAIFCAGEGVKTLTLYAFSTENWKRPAAEVGALMSLLAHFIDTKLATLIADGVQLKTIGRTEGLPEPARSKLLDAVEKTRNNTAQTLILALNYGGRAEIVDAANAAVARGEQVTEETFRRHLYAPDVPDPDLVIRTSGECRVSNFLLWESAYSEYWFTDTLWPDFTPEEYSEMIGAYANRDRRFGGRKEAAK
jgi:undecaprenyl diphosphate synthase